MAKKYTEDEIKEMNVYQRILCVKVELCEMGISKDRKQQHQGYGFRGVEDVLGVVSALHCKYRLDLEWRSIDGLETKTASNGKGYHMTGVCTYRIRNVDRPEEYSEFVAPGEGLDNSDKSSGKFCSYAYKNGMFYKYEIPVQGQSIDEYDPRKDVEDDSHLETPLTGGPPTPGQKSRIEEMKRDAGDVVALYKQCFKNQENAASRGGITKDNVDSYCKDLDMFRDAINADAKLKKPEINDDDYAKYTGLIKTSRSTIDLYFSKEQVGRSDEPETAKDKTLNMIGEQKVKARDSNAVVGDMYADIPDDYMN
tara:strand:- start:3431 stop:4360 length:930 start_codon:yes stop_codon:yes gene_type:complete